MALETKAIAYLMARLGEKAKDLNELQKDLRDFARICEVGIPEPKPEDNK